MVQENISLFARKILRDVAGLFLRRVPQKTLQMSPVFFARGGAKASKKEDKKLTHNGEVLFCQRLFNIYLIFGE